MSVHRPITAGALVALSLAALALTAPRIAPADTATGTAAPAAPGPVVAPAAARTTISPDLSGATASGPGTGAGPGAGAHARASAPASPHGSSPHDEGPPDTTASSYRLPGLATAAPGPLLRGGLPHAAARRGALVAGYPTRVLPAAPRSRVTASSVSPAAGRLQVALTASASGGSDAVLRFYRVHLTGLGLHEVPTRAPGGSQAAAFRRGPSTVVVTVSTGARTAYSVFATLDGPGT